MISRYPNSFFFGISVVAALALFYLALQLMFYLFDPPAVVDLGTIYNVPPGLAASPGSSTDIIAFGGTDEQPLGLQSENLPEGGPASADVEISDPMEAAPGPTVTSGSFLSLPISNSFRFFGTSDEDSPLVIFLDGRVTRYGRELGTDVEIFKGLQNVLSGYPCRSSLAEPAKQGEQSVIDSKPSDETGTGIAGPWNSPNFTQLKENPTWLLSRAGSEVFRVEEGGDIVLRGKIIAHDAEAVRLLGETLQDNWLRAFEYGRTSAKEVEK